MIHARIERYLRDAAIPFQRLPHPRAVTSLEAAEAEGISGWQVTKTVAVELASGEEIICVVPSPVLVDLDAVCDVTKSRDARLVEVDRLRELFPGCEPGAAPPFGKLWGLPVLCERALTALDHILVQSGTHDALLEIPTADFLTLEAPQLVAISVMPGEPWKHAMGMKPEPHAWHEPGA